MFLTNILSMFVLLAFFHPICSNDDVVSLSDEKQLIKYLLEHYEKIGVIGRPVHDTTDTVNVKYGLALIQILDLDEKNQVLTTNAWSRYTWKDELLKWHPEDFGGVTTVRIPVKYIWTPDIVLYNYADTRLKEHREALSVVENDGTVLWIPRAIYKSTCPIDITQFPFDIQQCHLKFGSWTYDGNKLDINFFDKQEVDVNDYVKSNEWHLLEHPAIKNNKTYPCCPEAYPDLTFFIKIKRIAAFYNYVLILPCVLLSSLTLVIFWLPPESPAKMMLGMNIFVAFFLLLRILADSTPPASKSIPLIGAFFCLNMILITLSTFLTVIIINLYFRGDKNNKVPPMVHLIVVRIMGTLFCMYNAKRHSRKNLSLKMLKTKQLITSIIEKGNENEKSSPTLKYNKWVLQPMRYYNKGHASKGYNNEEFDTTNFKDKSFTNSFIGQCIETDVREMRHALRHFISRIHKKDEQKKIMLEWRLVALILDRFFFYIYLIIIIISLGTIFPRPK